MFWIADSANSQDGQQPCQTIYVFDCTFCWDGGQQSQNNLHFELQILGTSRMDNWEVKQFTSFNSKVQQFTWLLSRFQAILEFWNPNTNAQKHLYVNWRFQ